MKKNFFGKVIDELIAVNNVSIDVNSGECLGIVGESGSGKTTLGLVLAQLRPYAGEVLIGGEKYAPDSKELRKKIQIVFQDPYNSLNPRMNILQIVAEGLNVHYPDMDKNEKKQKVIDILQEVGLTENDLYKYPHEFSGGQRQRIAIARALVVEPKILLLDEPTSALDVTVQAQVVELLQKLQKNKALTYVFISHDMKAIRAISDNVAVMKDGKIIECGTVTQIFETPGQDYTKTLINAAILA